MTFQKILPAAAVAIVLAALLTFPGAASALPQEAQSVNVAPDSAPDSAVSGVPEPATWALMFLGIGAVGAVMRSSRRPTRVALSDAPARPRA
jgi:PEP-CTERM motif